MSFSLSEQVKKNVHEYEAQQKRIVEFESQKRMQLIATEADQVIKTHMYPENLLANSKIGINGKVLASTKEEICESWKMSLNQLYNQYTGFQFRYEDWPGDMGKWNHCKLRISAI